MASTAPVVATPPPTADLALDAVEASGEELVFHVRATMPTACCPRCSLPAARIHSRYTRTLADVSAQGTSVRWHLVVRRFHCTNLECPRAIFGERLPDVVAPYARRTTRLATLLTRVSALVGAEAGARLLPALGLTASADTLLRLVYRAPLPTPPTPRVLGVDDWARRRGHTYGTVLVDLERHAIVDLLPERSADDLAAWLAAHPGVEVVSRDRAECYAEGARRGAPDAVQVADRWHLLRNVRDVLERVLQRHRPELRQAAQEPAADVVANDDAVAPAEPPPEASSSSPALTTTSPSDARRAASQDARAALYAEIHGLHAQGVGVRAISERLGHSRVTVRKYLRAAVCPERAPRRPSPRSLALHDALLRDLWEAGHRTAQALCGALQARGVRASRRTVERYIAGWRTPPTAMPPRAPTPRPPAPRQVVWWLLEPATTLPMAARPFMTRLLARCHALAICGDLAQTFRALVRARDVAGLGPWLEVARTCAVAEFRDFAAGLQRERAAIQAALELPWSNGQTEGQVTKIKSLKRTTYGRASVGLLRRRLLLAAAPP